ncbi:carboxy terminal-processing peptidase [Rhizobium laguerreae]|uniref:carboxy terminal-processing peptidase n=1 Tax=Rhizobium laguerreae TaxID=1076926 RepID=UPI001442718E|nr:carboxy terminal-processing peptidase [Rhizobium laguerreae]MBN9982743.1 carboxy terminal-processing peptidase [Rhizobium laguerreae]MBY3088174.1 carboxy terminal-processing peptidase [Rhizobium laguerreae]MBY3091886.1 carboxy terminal-processing peptidase [Rhizobium laguerreae]MBY3098342.1 carboxy terminal-processing peptidase [Rhizobium laguerreae]MBY3107887.1 carboxy terminal-processing peptidase [Rhizobium laguerreae]
MRIAYFFLGAFLAIAQSAYAEVASPPALAPLKRQAQAAELSAQFLSRYSYKPVPLDDALSARIMDGFIKSLDPDRMLFLQADIDGFMSDRSEIDDAIEERDLKIPFAIFKAYQQRVVDRMNYARNLLKQDFDFSAQEDYSVLRDKAPWPQSEAESNELWRKRVKSDWLRLKLGGQNDAAIRETLDKRYENTLERAYKFKSDDVFQSFMDAYATSIDPHTDYFGTAASADFNVSMKLSLFGIGAVLQERDDYTTIRELVPGGPAQLSGKLSVGDRITGVGQGKDGAIKDVVGTRLDEVVQMIRGKKGSVVRLDILPADAGAEGTHRVISLVRDKISLDKQAARKTVLSVKAGDVTRKIGIITLPVFYEDFEAKRKGDEDYKSASRDVAKLLDELKEEKVDSVLIDLRNNGGGSLDEAIDLTGLFIGNGPVVQQRGSDGKVEVRSSELAAPVWTGPVGVLINRGSASASEIFAAAIQDYGRGVIVGEPSFGKGTVQTVVDLDRIVRNSKPELGELKVTIAQFFRVNGGTTQLHGVTPDISLPGLFDPASFGETSYDNALPWAQIKPAKYTAVDTVTTLLPTLQSRHDARVESDPDYQRLIKDIADLKVQREKGVVSLNEAERRKEATAREKRFKDRAKAGDGEDLGDDGLEAGERSLSADIAIENARKNAKDVLLNEAAAILADEADLQEGVLKAAAKQSGNTDGK